MPNIQPNTYPNRREADNHTANSGPPTWVGLFEDIKPKNDMPGSYFSGFPKVAQRGYYNSAVDPTNVQRTANPYAPTGNPQQEPIYAAQRDAFNEQGAKSQHTDMWLVNYELPVAPNMMTLPMVVSAVVETEINVHLRHVHFQDPLINGTMYVSGAASNGFTTPSGWSAPSAAVVRQMITPPIIDYQTSIGTRGIRPVASASLQQIASMPAAALNWHLPLHKDPYFGTVHNQTQVYGNDILGTGDEMWNFVRGAGYQVGNAFDNRLPWSTPAASLPAVQ